MKPLFM